MISRWTVPASALAVVLSLMACQPQAPESTTNSSPTASSPVEGRVSLTGAGASFPAPLYQRWFSDFNKKYPNITVSYQSVGSGAGVQQFTAGTVDFGASDVAMKDEEMAKVSRGVLLLPMTAGGIVAAYNLPQVQAPIKLSQANLANIFLGKITKWNDPALVEDNPEANLPDLPIRVVHRADGSGTTGIFTQYLSAISPEWKEKVGDGKTVSWPTGVGGKGNEGVTAQIQQTQGALGYVEYGYAQQNGLKMAFLQNKAGGFIEPTPDAFKETLSAVELPENLRAFITNPEGPQSYPIVSYTWILAYKKYDDPNKAKALKAVVDYSLNEGQQVAPELGYVPLPENVVAKVEDAVSAIAVASK
uniref:Phosphate-binding protein n=1 Tax=Cyanothece sp. (strain PCC 7425 / ATCC 29141) TaxID=395961 RepID=B8HWD4_CYAP4